MHDHNTSHGLEGNGGNLEVGRKDVRYDESIFVIGSFEEDRDEIPHIYGICEDMHGRFAFIDTSAGRTAVGKAELEHHSQCS